MGIENAARNRQQPHSARKRMPHAIGNKRILRARHAARSACRTQAVVNVVVCLRISVVIAFVPCNVVFVRYKQAHAPVKKPRNFQNAKNWFLRGSDKIRSPYNPFQAPENWGARRLVCPGSVLCGRAHPQGTKTARHQPRKEPRQAFLVLISPKNAPQSASVTKLGFC